MVRVSDSELNVFGGLVVSVLYVGGFWFGFSEVFFSFEFRWNNFDFLEFRKGKEDIVEG